MIMKLLVLSVLVCAAMAQTRDTEPELVTNNQLNGTSEVSGDDVKRSTGIWRTYNGRSFILIGSTMTWGRAQTHCLALGGSLATIHNIHEENFVRGVVGARVAWIGLSDSQNEGYWLWINSDPLVFTKWCPREPNNYKKQQHCAVINYSSQKCWDDQNCSTNHPFVCQKKVVPNGV